MIYDITFFDKINLHQTETYHDSNVYFKFDEFLNFLLQVVFSCVSKYKSTVNT